MLVLDLVCFYWRERQTRLQPYGQFDITKCEDILAFIKEGL